MDLLTPTPAHLRIRLCWYAGEKYLRDLKAKEEFPPRILEGIEALAEFLVAETRTMERGTDAAKRHAKEEVPGDRIKDAPALARELRWRARHASGYSSDDDNRNHKKGRSTNGDSVANGTAQKRKRAATDHGDDGMELFRNYKRPGWDRVEERPTETETASVRARRPDSGTDEWIRELSGGKDMGEEEGGDEAQVVRRRDVIVKVRRTAKGLERQKVERVLEEWVWSGGTPVPTAAPAEAAKREELGEEDGARVAGEGAVEEDVRMEGGPDAESTGRVAVESGS